MSYRDKSELEKYRRRYYYFRKRYFRLQKWGFVVVGLLALINMGLVNLLLAK